MIDYDALKALNAVLEFQSFDKASKALGITQSAVTQRIQGFESFLGERLLVRKMPYKATKSGQAYLSLLRKVTLLESEMEVSKEEKPIIKIAMNRDSLDLYFLDLLSDKENASQFAFEIIADDQDNTLEYLKNGQVDMCISSEKKPLPHHNVIHLGDMAYSLVCSPSFHNKYFKNENLKDALRTAPLVVFDKYDKLQHSFLKDNFGIEPSGVISQMPSLKSFKTAILSGFGYGLIPLLDIQTEFKQKKAIEICPTKKLKVPLYLHQWEYQKSYIKSFNEQLLKTASKL